MEKKLHHFGHPLFTPTFNIAGAPGEEAQTRPILFSLCNIEGGGERGLYFYIHPLPQVMQLFSVNSTHAPVLHGVHIAPSRLTWGPLAGDTEKTEVPPLRATRYALLVMVSCQLEHLSNAHVRTLCEAHARATSCEGLVKVSLNRNG